MRSNSSAENDETPGIGEYFTFGELMAELARRKWSIVALTIGGLLLGIVFALTQSPRWTASAVIQLGQIGLSSHIPGNPEAFAVTIEPVTRTAERIRSRAFVRELLHRLGLPTADDTDNSEAQLIRNSLSSIIPRNTNLLEISVSGSSPQRAATAARMALQMLAAEHARLAEPTLARMRRDLDDSRAQLEETLVRRKELATMMKDEARKLPPSERFAESVLLSKLIATADVEIRELRKEILLLEEQLSPKRTFETAFLTDVDVPDRSTYPRKSLFALAGAGFGLLAAIAWILTRASTKR